MMAVTEVVRAPRGTTISCKSWQQEAAMRMLMNNLDPRSPSGRPIWSSTAGPARRPATGSRTTHRRHSAAPRERRDAAGAVGQAGGVFQTHAYAPRVLIANANLVPEWGTWEEFRRLDALGLTMYAR